MLKQFLNCTVAPANIILTLYPGTKSSYEVYGWAAKKIVDGVECVELISVERGVVMIIPSENVNKLTIKF